VAFFPLVYFIIILLAGGVINNFPLEVRSMLEPVRRIIRVTYCQMCIELDASKLSAISKTMGHATTRTTEEHYGRMKETEGA
jgi:hypothetical protein